MAFFVWGLSTESWFVQGLQPWCKEDALMVLLNATPGKSGYAAVYPNTTGVNDFSKPASIIYHQHIPTAPWQGFMLGFIFPNATATGCDKYTNGNLQKLCSDLWFLDNLDDASFIQVFKKFDLPAGTHPRTYAVRSVDETVGQLLALPDFQ